MTQIPAGEGGTLSADESFEFINNGSVEVQLSGLNPPCTEPDYIVAPNGGTTPAKIEAHVAPGTYPYTCNPDIEAGNPRIHIST